MKVYAQSGDNNIANVYFAELANDRQIEFVDSIPTGDINEKYVIIVSSLFGCPVGCPICDAGSIKYNGKLSKEEIFSQIDYAISKRFANNVVSTKKFKIQFARIGEPSMNPNVLDAIEELSSKFSDTNLIPSLSTIAPIGQDSFFEKLLDIKNKHFLGSFQLQFSIHSTDESVRSKIIPLPHWNFQKIAMFAERFTQKKDLKITLNFATINNVPINANVIADNFDPDKFLIKITPLNPTFQASVNNLTNKLDVENPDNFTLAHELKKLGFDVIISVGKLEENKIGSNCGQYIKTAKLNSFTYPTQPNDK